MTFLSVLSALKRVPSWVYAVVFAGLVLLAGAESVTRYGERKYDAGRHAVLDSMTRILDDSLRFERGRHEAALASAKGRTDTLVRVVRGRTDTLVQTISALSPDIRQHPQVQNLVAQCTALAQDCEKMRVAFKEERVRSDSLRSVLTAQTDVLAAQLVAQRDTITTLAKRPTKTKALAYALASAGLAFAAGVRR